MLFLVHLIILLILTPFTFVLLFTRTLSRFKFITKFRPLLDAYQGPYKIKFYYWTGVQLVIRVIFYGISSLDRSINLIVGIMLLSTMIAFEGVLRPFKEKHKNVQALLFILNLQLLFVILLHNEDNANSVNVLITLAAVHLFIIVIYHFCCYVHGGVIRNRMVSSVLTLKEGFINLINRRNVQQLEIPLRNIPPEVVIIIQSIKNHCLEKIS